MQFGFKRNVQKHTTDGLKERLVPMDSYSFFQIYNMEEKAVEMFQVENIKVNIDSAD